LFCNAQWLHRVVSDVDAAYRALLDNMDSKWKTMRTWTELAIENCLGRSGGKTSKIYSFGIFAERNSSNTSLIVRFVRKQYSCNSS
jgi:hypothetical protein